MSMYSQAWDNTNIGDLYASVLQFVGIKTSVLSFPEL